jgi:hypothetical protein
LRWGDRFSVAFSYSSEVTLKPIVCSIAFTGVAALAEGLEVTEVVAAAEVERDDVIDRALLGGAAALAGMIVAIGNLI